MHLTDSFDRFRTALEHHRLGEAASMEKAVQGAARPEVLLEVEDQVFGVHAAPIIAVYGVNDMAPWGHMYVNPGLTEPFKMPQPVYNFPV